MSEQSGLPKAIAPQLERRSIAADLGRRALQDTDARVRELCVRQLELEAQNRELRESRQRAEAMRDHYASLYESAPVALLVLDEMGLIQEVNGRAARLCGRERAQLIGLPFQTVAGVADRRVLWSTLRASAVAGEPRACELHLAPVSSGSAVDVQLVAAPLLGSEDDAVLGYRLALTDITPRLQAANALAQASDEERRLRARFEALDRASLAVSRALTRIGTMSLRDFVQVLVDQARALVDADYAAIAYGGGGTGRPEWLVEGSDAPHVDRRPRKARPRRPHSQPTAQASELVGLPIELAGRRLGTLYLTHRREHGPFGADELARAELFVERAATAMEVVRLHEVEARERSHLETVVEVGKVLTSTLERSALLEVLACLPVPWLSDFCVAFAIEDGRARPASVCHADAERAALLESLRALEVAQDDPTSVLALTWRAQRAVELERLTASELLGVGGSEAMRDALDALGARSALFVPLLAHGVVTGLLALFRTRTVSRQSAAADLLYAEAIAERAAMALENARLHAEARAAAAAREELLAVVSHDLRSPLTTIELSVDAMHHIVAAHAAAAELDTVPLAVVRRASRQMDRLIDDLLHAATIDEGRLTIEARSEAVPSVVDEVQVALAPLAAQRSITLEVTLAPELPPVLADRARLVQILQNLIGNAIKFTPCGGQVALGVAAGEGVLQFSVRDNGRGIPPEELGRIFERYWKGPRAQGCGTGLGLYITRGLVLAQGGRIWVESEVGSGSHFHFTLPIAS